MDQSYDLKQLLLEKERRIQANKLAYALPDTNIHLLNGDTIWNRHAYPKHLAFLKAGSEYFERAFIAANRVGKTRTGVIEVLYHATGQYPEWWEGKRFNRPVTIWVCGDRGETIRESIQKQIMELMPTDVLLKTSAMSGIPNAYGQYYIKHVSVEPDEDNLQQTCSSITIKTYQSGRTAFEAAAVHLIMLDEECPYDIYVECLLRTATTKGLVMLTFTPDTGVTETLLHFLNSKPEDHRFYVKVGWNDIPHMTEEEKEERIKAIPLHMRACRTQGEAYLGTGAVYPILDSEFICAPFEIPDWWPRAYALDVGWGAATGAGQTAALWGAWDLENNIMYVYSEYKRGQSEPVIHASAIKTRGNWIPGVIDTASMASSTIDGRKLHNLYTEEGLILFNANKAVEAGIFKVFQGLSTGNIKIFKTCTMLLDEMKIYRRDDNGHIAHKQKDDLCDCLRYLTMSGYGVAQTKPQEDAFSFNNNNYGKSDITGY